MTVPSLFVSWGFWYAVGAALVVVAALLLIGILLVARGIESEAERALAAGARIQENTRALWALAGARDKVAAIQRAVRSVTLKTAGLATAETEETRR